MGSKSSSKSRSSTNTTTNTKNLNLQGVQGTNVFTDGQVTVTDAGSTARALNYTNKMANKSIDANVETAKAAFEFGDGLVGEVIDVSKAFLDAQSKVNEASLRTVSDSLSYAKSTATDDTAETIQTMIKYGAGAVVVVAGIYAFGKAK